MWAVRRASNLPKTWGSSIGFSQACCAKSERASYLEDNVIIIECPLGSDTSPFVERFYSTFSYSPRFFMGKCIFSSQAGTSSGEEDYDLEDGFSELEAPHSADDVIQNNNMDGEDEHELIFGPYVDEEEGNTSDVEGAQNELEISETHMVINDKRSQRKRDPLALFRAILAAPVISIHNALDKWVDEGNDLNRAEISLAMLSLRERRMYVRALQLSEWLESSKQLDFVERDYASQLDLIAKVYGFQQAENYIDQIPKSFRGDVIYRTLLANCVAAANVKKAEEVFNKMKDLEFPITSFACNQLLLLYKRTDKKKIADVLLLMEKENVKPTYLTYQLLIEARGQSNDISGMDQIVEKMKAEGIVPDLSTQAILAKQYISGGLKDKAETVLKEMEGVNGKESRWAFPTLLRLYATLGKADEVGRLWKACLSNPRFQECMAAIEAWGRLKDIDEAEMVFEKMLKTGKKLSSRHYSVLLKVYANHKMLAKGKDLIKRMADCGCRIGPLALDAVVKLYVEAGEVEKADSMLQKVEEQNQMKPMFGSYMAIMVQYAKRGDISNTEKLFDRMRQVGYVSGFHQFQSLIQAYTTAKAPAYGMRERMKTEVHSLTKH